MGIYLTRFLLFILLCSGYLQCATAQTVAPPTSVIRFESGPDEWQGSLQTAINTYRNAAGISVELVAAIHIADPAYYEELNAHFANRDRVLFELVADADQRPSRNTTQQEASGLSLLQRAFAGLLGLGFQLQVIDYSAQNFVHADMNPAELQAAMAAKNENFFSLVMAVALAQMQSMEADTEIQTTSMVQLMAALSADNRRDAFKYLLATELARGDALTIDPALETQLTLIGDRNRIALQRLEESLEDTDIRTISLFFGAAHIAGLERELLGTLGFQLVDQRWLTAWSIPQ